MGIVVNLKRGVFGYVDMKVVVFMWERMGDMLALLLNSLAKPWFGFGFGFAFVMEMPLVYHFPHVMSHN